MPELPEVETVKIELNKVLKNKKIIKVEVKFDKLLKNVSCEYFQNELQGKTIIQVQRFGKYLILAFKENYLLIHLRMEGKLFYYHKEYKPKKHDHIIFYLDNNDFLIYNDVRKFGTFDYIKKEELLIYEKIKKLGLEPLSVNFTQENLYPKLKKSRKSIKETLLDQTIVSGLGNIYVDEVLYACKIHPLTKANILTKQEVKDIVIQSNRILKKAIENNGTTIKSFSVSDQIKGSYQNFLQVYAQTNSSCKKCGTKIKKIKVGSRGTHFCPNCQREK